jgi:hypothetical protein
MTAFFSKLLKRKKKQFALGGAIGRAARSLARTEREEDFAREAELPTAFASAVPATIPTTPARRFAGMVMTGRFFHKVSW